MEKDGKIITCDVPHWDLRTHNLTIMSPQHNHLATSATYTHAHMHTHTHTQCKIQHYLKGGALPQLLFYRTTIPIDQDNT